MYLGLDGTTVFIPFDKQLLNVRRTVKQHVLNGTAGEAFFVQSEKVYYADFLQQCISDADFIQSLLRENGQDMQGKKGNRICCLAIWQHEGEMGLLLHKRKNGTLVCSALPILTKYALQNEQCCMQSIRRLAEQAEGVQFHLSSTIRSGSCDLGKLLQLIAECLD